MFNDLDVIREHLVRSDLRDTLSGLSTMRYNWG
jgi:hypothetical protein